MSTLTGKPLRLVLPFDVGVPTEFFFCCVCGVRVGVNRAHPNFARLHQERTCPSHCPVDLGLTPVAVDTDRPPVGGVVIGHVVEPNDGVAGGQGRTARSLRFSADSLFVLAAVVVGIFAIGLLIALATHRAP